MTIRTRIENVFTTKIKVGNDYLHTNNGKWYNNHTHTRNSVAARKTALAWNGDHFYCFSFFCFGSLCDRISSSLVVVISGCSKFGTNVIRRGWPQINTTNEMNYLCIEHSSAPAKVSKCVYAHILWLSQKEKAILQQHHLFMHSEYSFYLLRFHAPHLNGLWKTKNKSQSVNINIVCP